MALRLMVIALLVIGSGSVFADQFTIANTGFLADGTTLGTPGTSTDGNWSLITCPPGSICAGAGDGIGLNPPPVAPYVTNDGSPGPLVYPFTGGVFNWMANDPTSQWISPRASYAQYLSGDPGSPAGPYTYRVTFDLTGFIPSTASLTFHAASDNIITDVLINGFSTGFGYLGFAAWSPDGTVNSNFIAGVNTLDFVVQNWDACYDHDNDEETPCITVWTPSGFRAELAGTADPDIVIPEPATMGLMGFGLIALGVAFRRRKSQA